MRVVCAIVALFALAAASQQQQKLIPQLFEANHEYIYEYRSLVASGLPRQSNQVSGLEKLGVLSVQVQEHSGNSQVLALQLRGVKGASFDKEVEDLTEPIENVYHKQIEEIQYQGPVFVKIENNHVESIKANHNMTEQVLNIYRGIASLFTVGNPLERENVPFRKEQQQRTGEQSPIVYRLHEDGITGNCETIYEVLSDSDDERTLNITKTKNYNNCMGRDPRFIHSEHDSQGCRGVCLTHKPEQIERNMEPEMADWESPITEGCPVDFHPKKELGESFLTVNYNMTTEHRNAIIEEVQAIDKKVLPLRKQQLQTFSLLKLKLIEKRTTQQKLQLQGATKNYEDLTYRFPEEHYHNEQQKLDIEYLALFGAIDRTEVKKQVRPMLKALAEIIVSDDIEIKGRTGDKIVQLAMALATLNEADLHELYQTVTPFEQIKKVSEKQYAERKVLIDMISLAGSNEAAEYLIKLIQKEQLTTLESVHVLEALQKNIVEPTTQVMDRMLELCTNQRIQKNRILFSTACISFAEVVNDQCEENDHTRHVQQLIKQQQHQQKEQRTQKTQCHEQQYKQYVHAIREHLEKAQEFQHQAIFLQTLGRLSHPEAIKALIPYVYGERQVVSKIEQTAQNDKHEDGSEAVQFIRQLAIYSLHHAAQEHGPAVQPIVQSIYFNQEEDYELRTAALTVLLATHPTEATLGRMVMELGQEHDMEVASFTYSALRSLANSTIPCMEQTARRVNNVLAALPLKTYGVHHSKYATWTHYHPLANLGLKAQWEVTHSNVSAIPRAVYAGLTSNKGPYVSTVGEFSAIVKGFENLDKFIFQNGGVSSVLVQAMQRVRRSLSSKHGSEESVEAMLEQIEKHITFNNDENREEPKAVFSGSFLGNQVFLPVDKEFMTKVAKKAAQQIQDMYTRTEVNRRFIRVLMPRTYVQVTPSITGLPVVLTNRHPIVISIALKDLKARLEPQRNTMIPTVFAVSGLIQPAIYHTSIHSAFTIAHFGQEPTAYGIRVVEETKATLPVDASIQYSHTNKAVAFTLRPRFTKVFYHKTKAVTFKTQALIIREHNQPMVDRFTVLKTQDIPFEFDRFVGQKLGMGLRLQGFSNNEELAVNFLRNREALKKNIVSSLIKSISNPWIANREWSLRMEQNEQKPIEEVKITFRLGNLLKERVDKQEQRQEQPQQLTAEQLQKDEQYPEELKTISYEQEYKKVTGRKPQPKQLEQALERMAQKTEKYWSQVDSNLRELLKKETAQVRSIEYVIAAKGQKQPFGIVGHMIVASTLDKQAKLAEIKIDVQDRPIELIAHAVVAYTPAPQPFESEIPHKQEQRGIAGVVAELETRQTGKQQYSAKVEMKKSQEQIKGLKTEEGQLYKPWYYQQCEQDKQEQKEEVSDACTLARLHKSALNEINFEIELPQKNHELLKNMTHQIREQLKIRLYRNLRADYTAENDKKKIQGQLIISEQAPESRIANLTILTPDNEKLVFERLSLPKALRPTTMWSLKEQMKAVLKNARPEPTCVYNGKYVRTFDNVTISLKAIQQEQEYILARDNDEEPKFTIIVDPKSQEKFQVKILLRNTTLLVLTPPTQKNQATYQVQMNSTQVPVSRKQTQVHQYASKPKHTITMYVQEHQDSQDVLYVKVKDQRILIAYDGENVKVQISKRQSKGQLTGLCGDMNAQHLEELTGPRGCIFEQEEDFVRSYTVGQTQAPKGQWQCPEQVQPRGLSQDQVSRHQQHQQTRREQWQKSRVQRQESSEEISEEGMIRETKMIEHKDKLCFSVEPVKTCEQSYRQQSETEDMPFVCLPKHHHYAKKLQREVQSHKIVSSIPSNVRSSIQKEVEVAKRCQL